MSEIRTRSATAHLRLVRPGEEPPATDPRIPCPLCGLDLYDLRLELLHPHECPARPRRFERWLDEAFLPALARVMFALLVGAVLGRIVREVLQ